MKIDILLHRYWFGIGIFVLVFIASFLRFYNYQNRWGLGYDQAHDALVARYALENHQLPFLGPFSSAGPFQTGGEWYWFIMLATLVYPHSVITPWIVLTGVYVVFVFLITILGKELVSKQFGLLVGLLSTVSTAQIAQSVNLTNQSPLALISLCSIWSMIKYVKERKNIYLFFLGLSVSLASTIHLQGASLFLVIFFYTTFYWYSGKKGHSAYFIGNFNSAFSPYYF